MTLREKQAKFLKMVADLVIEADEIGITVFVNEWYRTPERQKELVATGKSKTLNSFHLKGLAVDLIRIKDGKVTWDYNDYIPLGKIWQKMNGVWGGSWKFRDAVHFQYAEEKS